MYPNISHKQNTSDHKNHMNYIRLRSKPASITSSSITFVCSVCDPFLRRFGSAGHCFTRCLFFIPLMHGIITSYHFTFDIINFLDACPKYFPCNNSLRGSIQVTLTALKRFSVVLLLNFTLAMTSLWLRQDYGSLKRG